MTCPRSWQIEAVRDGRLNGKDLIRAVRHRELCADCTREQLELTHLAGALERLPLLARDPLTMRRERQQLMSEMNDEILAPVQAKARFRAPALIAGLAIACGLFVQLRKTPTPIRASSLPRSVIEVHAEPDASWTENLEGLTDRIDLSNGNASFRVHPHPGRRVLIRLPDGEVEDVGTVFEVDVHDHRTRRIAVQEGHVAVRLQARPEFALSAGEAWRQPELLPSASSSAAVSVTPSSSSSAGSAPVLPQSARKARHVPSVLVAATAAKPEGNPRSDSTQARAAKTEDLAYLNIITLLNQRKYAAAQSAAKDYLLLFPNGFRRVEVLNVVIHGANIGPLNSD